MQRSHGRKEQGLAQDSRGAMLSSKAARTSDFLCYQIYFCISKSKPLGVRSMVPYISMLEPDFPGSPIPELKENIATVSTGKLCLELKFLGATKIQYIFSFLFICV